MSNSAATQKSSKEWSICLKVGGMWSDWIRMICCLIQPYM